MFLEIDLDDVVGDDARAEIDGLLPHQLHQLRAVDAVARLRLVRLHPVRLRSRLESAGQVGTRVAGRGTGIVFDLGRQIELAQGKRALDVALSLLIAPSKTNGCKLARAA